MSKTRNLSDLLDANGDVKSTALDNVPASDVVNDTTPQLGGNLDINSNDITGTGNIDITGTIEFGDGHQLGNETTYDNLVVKSSTDENMVLSTGGTGQLIVKTGSTTLDNGSEKFRIDNSGNIHIAKTARADNTVGHSLQADGLAVHTRDGAELLFLNRKTSDGKIVSVRKDNTEVGTIGSYLGSGVSQFYISGADTGFKINSTVDVIAPSDASGANRDNAITLGDSGNRFANLYLGGNIYLGGTGSANALDDYEEGSFTPQYRGSVGSAGSLAYSSQEGRYTKIGRLVFVQIRLILSNNGSFSSGGDIEIYGLPFTVANQAAPPPASLELRKVSIGDHTAYASFNDNSTYLKIKVMSSTNNPDTVSHGSTVIDSGFLISGMYVT